MTDDQTEIIMELQKLANATIAKRDARIAELEKMLAVHRLAVDVDALKARIAELEKFENLAIDGDKQIGALQLQSLESHARIAELEAENAKLRAALKPFSDAANELSPDCVLFGDANTAYSIYFTAGHIRAARAAYLGEKE